MKKLFFRPGINPYRPQYDVLIGDVSREDQELYFGLSKRNHGLFTPPYPKGHQFVRSTVTRFDTLLRDLGIFNSSSEAKGAGYGKTIPVGWTELLIERKVDHVRTIHWICILKK